MYCTVYSYHKLLYMYTVKSPLSGQYGTQECSYNKNICNLEMHHADSCIIFISTVVIISNMSFQLVSFSSERSEL